MPSKKSGGKRAVEKKHRARDAERPRGYSERTIAAVKRLFRAGRTAGDALDEAIALLRLTMRQAATDPGMPPEYRREQTARIGAYLIKAADPKRMIDDLAAELREAHAVIVGLRDARAAQVAARDPGGSPPPALQ